MADGVERELEVQPSELRFGALGCVSKDAGDILELLANPSRDHFQVHRRWIVEPSEVVIECSQFSFATHNRFSQ